MGVSKNRGTPKSSIIGFSILYHPFWGNTIFGNTHMGKEANIANTAFSRTKSHRNSRFFDLEMISPIPWFPRQIFQTHEGSLGLIYLPTT